MKSKFLTLINFICSLTLLLTLLPVSSWLVPVAQAQAGQVGCTNGVGDVGALIGLIKFTNSNPGQDTLALGANCVYEVKIRLDNNGNGLPLIRDDLVIEGNGATIRRVPDPNLINPFDGFYRLLSVEAGDSLTLQNLKLQDGLSLTGNGGAIQTGLGSILILENVSLSGNQALEGGAFFAEGMVFIDQSEFLRNSAGNGGGLYSRGEVRVTGSRFESNQATSNSGGGLFIEGSIAMTNTQVVSNTAADHGGGLFISGEIKAIEAKLIDSQVANNRALKGDGGGIVVTFDTLVLTNTAILSNSAEGSGGGIGTQDGANVIMNGGQVTGNRALNDGGGLAVDGKLTMRATLILSNTAQTLGGGVSAGTAVVENSRFENNQATQNGAGALVANDLILRQTTVINNRAQAIGGVFSRRVTLEGNTFVRNRGRVASLGLQTSSDTVNEIINNLWIDNISDSTDDPVNIALTNSGAILPSAHIFHNTIFNSTPHNASAFFIHRFSATLQNNIVTKHAIGVKNSEASSLITTSHNLYFGNTTNELGPITTSSNNLEAAPLFVNPATGDFHLQPDSSAINKGLNVGIRVDLDGAPRPFGPGFDIGAFEFASLPPNPGGNFSIYLPLVIK